MEGARGTKRELLALAENAHFLDSIYYRKDNGLACIHTHACTCTGTHAQECITDQCQRTVPHRFGDRISFYCPFFTPSLPPLCPSSQYMHIYSPKVAVYNEQ